MGLISGAVDLILKRNTVDRYFIQCCSDGHHFLIDRYKSIILQLSIVSIALFFFHFRVKMYKSRHTSLLWSAENIFTWLRMYLFITGNKHGGMVIVSDIVCSEGSAAH